MTNTELAAVRYEQFEKSKRELYNSAVDLYRRGYPIKSIVNQLYPRFHADDKAFTKTLVNNYVLKSIYDFLMKEKHQEQQ